MKVCVLQAYRSNTNRALTGTDEAHRYLWTMTGTTLELTHNYDTEKDDAFKYHPGNQVR